MRFLGSIVLLAVLAACATADGDPRDPFEGFNRGVYKFNETVDAAIAKPVATAYRDLLHEEIRSRVRNFFSNIADLFIGVNNLLQGKLQDGVEDWARFAFNSTFGLLGIHDVASDMGIEKHNEDFGQTLGSWGVGSGAYLVLPILGPSTIRDGFGLLLDTRADLVFYIDGVPVHNSLYGTRAIANRANLLDASSVIEQAALDKYAFVREAWLQRRRNLVYDGDPPREREEPDDEPTK